MKFFKYLKESWPTVRDWIVKTLLTKIFPKTLPGPWGLLVTFFVTRVFDKTIKPLWDWLIRKAYSKTRKVERKPRARKLENAKTEQDFDRSFDNMP